LRDIHLYARKIDEQRISSVQDEYEKLSQIWVHYLREVTKAENVNIYRMQQAQDKALNLLQQISPALYKKSLEIDPNMIPFNDQQIVVVTPPNPDYSPPDGRQTDATKVWKM